MMVVSPSANFGTQFTVLVNKCARLSRHSEMLTHIKPFVNQLYQNCAK
ncbi:hypothetical protein SHAM105786_00060 [Shewanella amazonensis]